MKAFQIKLQHPLSHHLTWSAVMILIFFLFPDGFPMVEAVFLSVFQHMRCGVCAR